LLCWLYTFPFLWANIGQTKYDTHTQTLQVQLYLCNLLYDMKINAVWQIRTRNEPFYAETIGSSGLTWLFRSTCHTRCSAQQPSGLSCLAAKFQWMDGRLCPYKLRFYVERKLRDDVHRVTFILSTIEPGSSVDKAIGLRAGRRGSILSIEANKIIFRIL